MTRIGNNHELRLSILAGERTSLPQATSPLSLCLTYFSHSACLSHLVSPRICRHSHHVALDCLLSSSASSRYRLALVSAYLAFIPCYQVTSEVTSWGQDRVGFWFLFELKFVACNTSGCNFWERVITKGCSDWFQFYGKTDSLYLIFFISEAL